MTGEDANSGESETISGRSIRICSAQLRALRKKAGLTQAALAEKSGFAFKTLQRAENSKRPFYVLNSQRASDGLEATPLSARDQLDGLVQALADASGDDRAAIRKSLLATDEGVGRGPSDAKVKRSFSVSEQARVAFWAIDRLYGVRGDVLSILPFIYLILAERSLQRRRDVLGRLEEREAALAEEDWKQGCEHLEYVGSPPVFSDPVEEEWGEERSEIDRRRLFQDRYRPHLAEQFDDDSGEAREGRGPAACANPFVNHLRELAAECEERPVTIRYCGDWPSEYEISDALLLAALRLPPGMTLPATVLTLLKESREEIDQLLKAVDSGPEAADAWISEADAWMKAEDPRFQEVLRVEMLGLTRAPPRHTPTGH